MKKLLVMLLCASVLMSNISLMAVAEEEVIDGPGAGKVTDENSPEEPGVWDGSIDEIVDDDDQGETVDEAELVGGDDETESDTEPEPSETEAPDPDEGDDAQAAGDDEDKETSDEVKQISAGRSNISFGTTSKGAEVSPETFTITNDSDTPVRLKWVQSDFDGVFGLDVLSDINSELAPGDKLDCMVYVTSTDTLGDFSGNITFQDVDDATCNAVVSVSVRVDDIREEPEKEEEEEEEKEEENVEGEKSSSAADKQESSKAAEKESSSSSRESSSSSEKKQPVMQEETAPASKNRYVISAVCSPKKAGYTSGGGTFSRGDGTVLTVYGKDGYSFKGWYKEGGEKVSDRISFAVNDINSSEVYEARFDYQDYEIKVKSENKDYGAVSGGGWFDKGDDTEIEAKPKDGYTFAGWYEKDRLVSREKKYKVKNIKKDHKYIAVFKSETHTVSVTAYPVEGGTVAGGGKVRDDKSAKISAKANKGYVFKGFLLNNQTVTLSDTYTINNVDRDLSFTAYFEKEAAKTYRITSGVSNGGGFISPSGELTVSEHGEMTYTISPENGYGILEVAVDGKKLGAVKSYTFKNIKKDHTIAVAFAPKKGNVKKVRMEPIISVEEAASVASEKLVVAPSSAEGRSSDIITPEMYAKMKEEGTLTEALKIQEQNVVGMDDTGSLKNEVNEYNYDTADGLYQAMDLSPEVVAQLIASGDDKLILKQAYEEGLLDIIINNQYLVPGRETDTDDIFAGDNTIRNMFEFVSGVLTDEEKLGFFEGREVAVSLGIAKADDINEEYKKEMATTGAVIDEYFYMTVMKESESGSRVITELNHPIEVVLDSPGDVDCIVRVHDDKAEILEDIDDDPSTITIQTDRFSPYAFAKNSGNAEASGQQRVAEDEVKAPEPAVAARAPEKSEGELKKPAIGGVIALVVIAAIVTAAVNSGKKRKKRK